MIVTITPQFPTDSFPKTMIINYGNGITCSDGYFRKGKIIRIIKTGEKEAEKETRKEVDFEA